MFTKLNLKWKISLMIAVTIIIVMFFVGYITYIYTTNMVSEQIDDTIRIVKDSQKTTINTLLHNINNQASNFASNQRIINLALFLSPLLSSIEKTNISEVLNTYRYDRIIPVMDVLTAQQELVEGALYSKIVSPDGVVILDTRIWEDKGTDPEEEEKDWRKYVGQGIVLEPGYYKNTVISELVYENEGAVILFHYPIYKPQNKEIIGYYVLGLSLIFFADNLSQPPVEEGTMALINNRGIIFNHNDNRLIGSRTRDNWLVERVRRGENSFKGEDQGLYKVVEKLDDDKEIYLSFNIPVQILNQPVRRIRNIIFIISGLGIILISFCAYYFINGQLSPLNNIMTSFSLLEKGELKNNILLDEKECKRNDEIGILGQAFNSMIYQLKKMITSIISASDEVSGSSRELQKASKELDVISNQVADIVQEVANGSSEQAKNIDLINVKIKNLAEGINNLGNFSRDMEGQAMEMSDAVKRGEQEIARASKQMGNIKTAIKEVATGIDRFNSISSQIDSMVESINHIAEQTNLLALNAAIEAARAGSAGRGFSVVADEINQLANASVKSADEISNLVKEIKKETDSAGDKMIEGTQEVNNGEKVINITEQAFAEIQGKIEEVIMGIYKSNQVVGNIRSEERRV